MATGKEIRRIEGFSDNLPVMSLAIRKDGQELLAGAGLFPNETRDLKHPATPRDAGTLRVIPLDPAAP